MITKTLTNFIFRYFKYVDILNKILLKVDWWVFRIALKFSRKGNSNFILHEGVIPFEKFQNSICLISDWSGISFEYAFIHEKPVIFIDVPKKDFNPEARKFLDMPIEIEIREKLGNVVLPKDIKEIPKILEKLIDEQEIYQEQIKDVRKKMVFNLGRSSDVGIKNIFEILQIDKK